MTEHEPAIDRAVRLHAEAVAALEAGAVSRARTLAAESLSLFEADSGPTHPDVANVLNCLSTVHEREAEYLEAER